MKKIAFMGPGTYSTASPTMSTARFRTMPRMAKGGIIPKKTLLVDARTKKPYALAGEKGPEAVVPLKKESGMHSVIKLAAAYIREYPITSLAQSAELIEKIGEIYKVAQELPRMSAERFGQKFNPALVKGTKIQASANAAARRQAHTPVTTSATAPLPRYSPSPIRMSRVPLGIGQSPMMRKAMKGRAVAAARSKAHATPPVRTQAPTAVGPVASR